MLFRTLTAALMATSGLLALSPALAQPARIDYSRGDARWHDQAGQPSNQTGYDGRSPYTARDNRNDDRDARQDNDGRSGHRTMRDNRYNPNWGNWRDNRRQSQWDASVHNGYYIGNTWYRGAPPRNVVRRRDYNPGYRTWVRGARLDQGSYNRFRQVDYRDQRLREPPRGYRWVEDDRGDYLLAAVIGGLIAEVIVNPPR